MKTIVDYLKENGEWSELICDKDVVLSLSGDYVLMKVDECEYKINIENAEDEIQVILDDNHGIEIRFCEECGIPYDMGFTTDDGGWYCCQDCFESAMDNDCGKGKWRATDEAGEYGGYYEYLNDDGEWEDTGIYYTEWN